MSERRAHMDVLGEVVFYGRNTLKMTDAEMARELGYSREFIGHVKKRKGMAFRCKSGHLLPPGRFVYCAKCDPDPLAEVRPRILCLQPGCKRMSNGGECSQCRAKRRYKENPEFKKRHDAATASWAARNPRRAADIRAKATARYLMRRAIGWTTFDPLKD